MDDGDPRSKTMACYASDLGLKKHAARTEVRVSEPIRHNDLHGPGFDEADCAEAGRTDVSAGTFRQIRQAIHRLTVNRGGDAQIDRHSEAHPV